VTSKMDSSLGDSSIYSKGFLIKWTRQAHLIKWAWRVLKIVQVLDQLRLRLLNVTLRSGDPPRSLVDF